MGEDRNDSGTGAAQADKKQAYASGATAQPPRYLWWTGRLTPWAEATVHVSMVGWPAVGAVFEGIRAYWNPEQERLYVFRLNEHMRRFAQSMKLMPYLEIGMEEVGAAVVRCCRTDQRASIVHPTARLLQRPQGMGTMGDQGMSWRS
ncbi:MAG: hypothetical protein U0531_11120 [Dehalococcoidia bacterium]